MSMRRVHLPFRVNEDTFEQIRSVISGDEEVSEVFDEVVDDYRPALVNMTNRRFIQLLNNLVLGDQDKELDRIYDSMSNEEIAEVMSHNADSLEGLASQRAREAVFLRDIGALGFQSVMSKILAAIVKIVIL